MIDEQKDLNETQEGTNDEILTPNSINDVPEDSETTEVPEIIENPEIIESTEVPVMESIDEITATPEVHTEMEENHETNEEISIEESPVKEVEDMPSEIIAKEEPETEVPEIAEIPTMKAEEPVMVPKPEEFDWDSYEQENIPVKDDKRKEYETLYTRTFTAISELQLIQAKVVNITDKDVVLNIGYKSDGLVPLSEFKHLSNLKIGDDVDVIVESTEGRDGQIMLSHKKAIAESAWNKIVIAHDSGQIIQGHIKDRTKGGMVVDLFGLDAFLPGSQLDIKPVQDYDQYVGTIMDLKVVKLNPAFRNIVVSHKAIIEQDIQLQRSKILSKLEKGQVLEGIVKNLTSFGVFVDLGGVDGLIHITDVSWGRINHPNQLLEIGQKINVVVLDYDQEKNRISLGMKQLTAHPWETLPEDIVESSVLKGKVVNIEDYGAFIEIYPGVEGLVHVSEMTWSQHLKSPSEYVKLNDEVDVKVLSIIRDERKLSLGMKQLTEDPWSRIYEKYPKESKFQAVVKNVTNFGLFVELEEGIDGLIHISDISWTKKYNHPAEFAKIGDTVDVMVLDIDQDNRRLSLGHKQLEEDPWETYKEIFQLDSIHEGTIARIDDKGATIILPYGIEGFCPARQLQAENDRKLNVDEVLSFKVMELDKPNRKIILSHTLIWKENIRQKEDAEKSEKKKVAEKTRKAISQVKQSVKRSTFASELDVLQELKDKMIEDEKHPSKSEDEKPKKAKKAKPEAPEAE
jgi:small subunit ribosomal protein S1